jgi:hypothetical protein
MTNELTTRQEASLVKPTLPRKQLGYVDAIQVINAIAPDDRTAASTFGMTKAQTQFAMWTAYEIGLPFTAGPRVFYVSQDGKLTLKPEGVLALIQSSPDFESFTWEGDNNSQTVYLKRKGRPQRRMTLTLKEAQEAGWKSAAWKTTPANLLRWRLIGWLGKLDWNDVLLGMAIADDSYMNIEITEDGDVKTFEASEWHEVKEVAPNQAIPQYGIDTAHLIELASTEEIMAANGGQFPLDAEAVNRTVHDLVMSGKITLESPSEPDAA